MSAPETSRMNGHLLQAIFVELDALSAELGPADAAPRPDAPLSVLARATDRLNAWCEAITDEAGQAGLGFAATRVARLREELALEEDHRAALAALSADQRERVRALRKDLAMAGQRSASLEEELAGEDDLALSGEEAALLEQERALYAAMSGLAAHAESEHLARMDRLREENAALAGGDGALLAAAERLAGLYARVAPLIPGVEERGLAELRAELQEQLEGAQAERARAASRFEERLLLSAELDALEQRLAWSEGELRARRHWRELLAGLEAPLAADGASLDEQSGELRASQWSPADAERVAESDWIGGEIIGRTVFLELLGNWLRAEADEVQRTRAELRELEDQAGRLD